MPHEGHDEIWCPVNATLALMNRRWTLHIVRALLEGKKRFNEIGRMYGINPRTLSERLRQLESAGLLERHASTSAPSNIEYSLTKKGLALNCIIESLADWGCTWMTPDDRGC
ncbi:MAG: helix-turn-helix domain-containing protein [Fimbriimonadaceae bacterium]